MKIIKYKGITESEYKQIIEIFKDQDDFQISQFNVGNKNHIKEKKEKILKLLEVNDKVECNKDVCFYLGVHTRTLQRYIKELEREKKLKAYLTNFKNGGRGYVIESFISKEKRK